MHWAEWGGRYWLVADEQTIIPPRAQYIACLKPAAGEWIFHIEGEEEKRISGEEAEVILANPDDIVMERLL